MRVHFSWLFMTKLQWYIWYPYLVSISLDYFCTNKSEMYSTFIQSFSNGHYLVLVDHIEKLLFLIKKTPLFPIRDFFLIITKIQSQHIHTMFVNIGLSDILYINKVNCEDSILSNVTLNSPNLKDKDQQKSRV